MSSIFHHILPFVGSVSVSEKFVKKGLVLTTLREEGVGPVVLILPNAIRIKTAYNDCSETEERRDDQ